MKEKPFFKISLDEIAAPSEPSKPTIYRRWESLEKLCVDAFFFEAQDLIRIDETGSLEKDLMRVLIRFGKCLNGPWGRALRTDRGTALKSSTAEVVMRNYYAQLWKHISDILERAQAKDELDRDININHFVDRR